MTNRIAIVGIGVTTLAHIFIGPMAGIIIYFIALIIWMLSWQEDNKLVKLATGVVSTLYTAAILPMLGYHVIYAGIVAVLSVILFLSSTGG